MVIVCYLSNIGFQYREDEEFTFSILTKLTIVRFSSLYWPKCVVKSQSGA